VGEIYLEKDQLVRTEFYNDWLRPQKLQHSIAAMVSQSSNRIVLCSTLRPGRHGAFTENDITFYKLLLPHLRRAVLIRERLAGVFDAGFGRYMSIAPQGDP
jgi:hypothetical protein